MLETESSSFCFVNLSISCKFVDEPFLNSNNSYAIYAIAEFAFWELSNLNLLTFAPPFPEIYDALVSASESTSFSFLPLPSTVGYKRSIQAS